LTDRRIWREVLSLHVKSQKRQTQKTSFSFLRLLILPSAVIVVPIPIYRREKPTLNKKSSSRSISCSTASNNIHTTMAIGPLARLLAQMVIPVVAVLARALPAAYAQALQNAKKAGVDAAPAAGSILRKTISRSEALQVLNLTEKQAVSPEAIQKVCQ
jgi:hypothetical protein